jgi:hypothetical protein
MGHGAGLVWNWDQSILIEQDEQVLLKWRHELTESFAAPNPAASAFTGYNIGVKQARQSLAGA